MDCVCAIIPLCQLVCDYGYETSLLLSRLSAVSKALLGAVIPLRRGLKREYAAWLRHEIGVALEELCLLGVRAVTLRRPIDSTARHCRIIRRILPQLEAESDLAHRLVRRRVSELADFANRGQGQRDRVFVIVHALLGERLRVARHSAALHAVQLTATYQQLRRAEHDIARGEAIIAVWHGRAQSRRAEAKRLFLRLRRLLNRVNA